MPSTYAELKDQVRNFINKPDIDQTIDTFIDLAEADIARKVRHWKMEKRATVQLDDQYSRVPTDWLESIRFYLSDSNTYNWLLQDAPDVYLYGTLMHTAPFLGEDARIPVWANLYQSALDSVNLSSEKAMSQKSGLRMHLRSY